MASEAMERKIDRRIEFLRDRQEGIGASDLPRILGTVDWGDALTVYHEKTRPIDADAIRDEMLAGATPIDLVRGNVLEPLAAREFFRRTGRQGRHERNRAFTHPEFPHVRIHTDGTQFADDEHEHDGPGTLEAKAPRGSKFDRIVEGGLDEENIIQIQTELAVRRHSWGSLALYSLEASSGPLHAVDVLANESLGAWLLAKAETFWTEHVERRIPPDPDAWASERDFAPPLNLPSGDVIDLDSPKARALAEKVNEAVDLKKRGKELYDLRRDEMGEFLREIGKVGIRVPGLGTYRWVETKGRSYLSKTRVVEAAPIDRDAFVRWLTEMGHAGELPASPSDVEALAGELALDVEALCTTSAPSAYVRAYPKGD